MLKPLLALYIASATRAVITRDSATPTANRRWRLGNSQMRGLYLPVFLAVVATGALAFSLGGTSAQTPSVDLVAIDVEPTGNTCNSVGTIESMLSNVPLNTPTTIDVVVRGVPAGPGVEDGGGIYGTGFELRYNDDVLRVTGSSGGNNSVLQLCSSSQIPFEVTDAVPDADGMFRVDSVDLGGVEESGDGRLFSITVECIAQGSTFLGLTDTSTGGGDNAGVLGDSGNVLYTVETEQEANLGCGTIAGTETPAPTATPVATPTATPTQPPTPTPTVSPTRSPTPTLTIPPGMATTTESAPVPGGGMGAGVSGTATGTPRPATGTPSQLPRTGGADDGGGAAWVLIVLAGGAAVVTLAGGAAYARYHRNRPG